MVERVRACYCDLDGTLVRYETPFAAIYTAALNDLGVEARGLEAYNDAFFAALGEAEDPFAAAISQVDVDVRPDAFSDALVEAEAARVAPTADADATLEAIGEEYRLGVLTNGVGRAQRAKLDAAGLAEHFETVVVSGEVGVRKPDHEVYRIAEDRLPAASYTFVADDLDRDVRPATGCGWRGVYVGEEQPDDVACRRRFAGVADVL